MVLTPEKIVMNFLIKSRLSYKVRCERSGSNKASASNNREDFN